MEARTEGHKRQGGCVVMMQKARCIHGVDDPGCPRCQQIFFGFQNRVREAKAEFASHHSEPKTKPAQTINWAGAYRREAC